MRTFAWICSSFALLALTACGGGGGSSSFISVSPASVSFSAIEGASLPPPVLVHVSFSGDVVVVGSDPDVEKPSWLNVAQQGAATVTGADFLVSVVDTSTPGTRSVSVRFVTAKADGSDAATFELPVTYTVNPYGIGQPFDATTSANLSFTSIARSTQPAQPSAGYTISIVGSRARWRATTDQPWLKVGAANGTGAGKVVVTADSSTQGRGTFTGQVTITDDDSGATRTFTATLTVLPDVIEVPFDATTSANLGFTSIARSTQPAQPSAGYTISIVGSRARWRATTDQPWLKVSAANGTGAGKVVVTADSSMQGRGTFTGQVTITDDDSGAMRTFTATLVTRAANLTVTPTTVSFSVDTLTPVSAFSKQVTISDELNGAQASEAVTWSVQSVSANWFQWAPTSGSSSPSVTGSVSLTSAELAKLVPGHYSATVTIAATTAAGTSQTVTVPVELDYQPAYVSFVGSYIGLENQAGSMYVRGTNFSKAGGTVSVMIGSTELAALAPDGDTQVRVNYPALPAGRYPVAIKNVAGIPATNAELVVLSPPTLPYQAISAPSSRTRLVYDAERETLYALNRQDQSIERYTRVGGVWTAGTPYILPNLSDIALAPNGRLLIVMQQTTMSDIPLTGGPFIAQQRNTFTDTFCGGYMATLSVANDGKAFVVTHLAACSGYSDSYIYDVATYSLRRASSSLYNGTVSASADGSRLYAGSNGLSPAPDVKIFNSLDDSITATSVNFNLYAVTVSGNASRVILQSTEVYSGSLSLTGHLPSTQGVVLASRDSSRAYVYRDDSTGGGPRLDIYDLNGSLQASAIYPLLKTVPLADAPNSSTGNYFAITMAETPDGNTVFVSGKSRIVVVPVR